ncbi:hypothetical protein PIIN_08549 [Serendipita indica DSM 11827]|uniref:ZZ-type domain-containing protein n=1 Tax=Serendipita indica (strain DSM 11827) TaxID=1109443 RepID=G4TTF4_SERID|nr:hypothetical protein PIIN_08549 [Serendipita indica DSM 11827]
MATILCDSCKRGPLLEYFTCHGCINAANADTYDLCWDCASNCAREAHEVANGSGHVFRPFRLRRICDYCQGQIASDFLMCTACRQDSACYDLCYTCALAEDGAERHALVMSRQHTFRLVQWDANMPTKQPQEFRSKERWWCNGCSNELTGVFFHCLGCGSGASGFDICVSCADRGGLFRHGDVPTHLFLFVRPVVAHSLPLPSVKSTRRPLPPAP